MKRVIYSIYIDIPQDELDWQPPYSGETESKNDKTKRKFAEHSDWLKNMQMDYANSIGVEYRFFPNDDRFKAFKKEYNEKYPFVTAYNVVNFYKIHLMYELAKEFDEVLYMDLDVTPLTSESFFDAWNLSEGVAILKNEPKVNRGVESIKNNTEFRKTRDSSIHSIRSPAAKYWNCYAMLEEEGFDPSLSKAYNTGIVGISAKHLEQLGYFDEFDYILNLMCELRDDEHSMYPMWIQEMFGWDNETIWGFYMESKEIPRQWLDGKWHHFMDKHKYIPKGTAFVHIINKEIEFVREWCEARNILHI